MSTDSVNFDWMEFTAPEDCQCYECTSPEVRYNNGVQHIENNVKHHTFGEPCENCGKPKSEYRDLGRKGYYICWYCNERAAGPRELTE